MPPRRIKLGVLTPSSNTALEPLTQELITAINTQFANDVYITVHFSRFPVTTISLTAAGLAQFDLEVILSAAELLAHASVDVIGWSGTAAGWLGFSKDEELCTAIQARTSIPATTSILSLNRALSLFNISSLGLVTPYLDDVQAKIIANYAAISISITPETERHMRIVKNGDIADVSEETLDELVKDVVAGGAKCVTTFCTNLIAAQRVEKWEEEWNVPVFDTVTTVVWDMLRVVEVDFKGLKGWGQIFEK